jgi:rhodanese-related sulfurtransferase
MSAPKLEGSTITPVELSEKLRRGETVRVVDVREPIEFQIARIDGSELIPLAELPTRIGAFDPDQEIVVVCHHGIRSHHACEYLRNAGITNVRNLTGGIDRWSEEVDPTLPRY